jgi:predicted acylesterase/phospholipase RssA
MTVDPATLPWNSGAMSVDEEPRRSLILAGGGSKVAFQAGVLQVWLDEAGVTFDHADGASGGVLNLAMWCQGMSGEEIADRWRKYRPLSAIDPDLAQLAVLPFAKSMFRYGRFRRNVLSDWGLDWCLIRETDREATFNLYDFTNHEHVVEEPSNMDEDRLISAISLPMWFPPVEIAGHTFIDAVFVTDANLEEAIRRGADELWVIWTVSSRGRWNRGFVAIYFQMIEAMANAQLKAVMRRIKASNAARDAGLPSEFERKIEVKTLKAEVPLHYLLNFTNDRVRRAVELGVQSGRRWCKQEGIGFTPLPSQPPPSPRGSVRFDEVMAGFIGLHQLDYVLGAARGRIDDVRLLVQLSIEVDELDQFVVQPEHEAAVEGWIVADVLGGRLEIDSGTFNLFVDQDDPSDKRMIYRLCFHDLAGTPLTLVGHKVVKDHPGPDLWRDTTTLYTRIVVGHNEGAVPDADVVASGIIRVSLGSFARQLTTFRGDGTTALDGMRALARFGQLFLGGLWDVYGREAL